MSDSRRHPEALLRRLEWTVIRRLDGLLQGDYRTFLRGFGLDLADLREYQFHDDVRNIDWNVTARLGVPHVREHHEDRDITAWFLLDLSPSVDFGSGQVNKRTMLVEVTAVLARLLTRHGNRVGAIFYSGSSGHVIPAGSDRRHVLHLLSALEGQPQLARAPATDLRELLDQAMRIIRRRSLVFLVSDFISRPGWEQPLAHLTRRHEVLAVRLSDPLDRELPDLGLIVMRDSETGEQLLVDTHDRRFRRRFAEIARDREALIRGGLQRAGVDTLELSTEEDLTTALIRFADLRKQHSRLAAGRAPAGMGGAA
jgi:uncharacterized protein (DUF58 family)